MRPIPGTADAQRAGAYDDGLCLPTPTTAPVACFFATEDSLRETSHGDSPDMSPDVSFHRSRLRRKPSPDAISSRSQLPSPTPTGHSIASLSSSVLDSEFDMDTPDMHARPSSIPESSASVGPSADSVSIIGSAISSCGSSRAPSASPPPYQRRGRPASPGSSAHNHSPRDDATPQFIMPSLAIPQRRPFSDAGKSVGKLKILVAGRPGIGKTSLVHAMAHCCEHIVHMDPAAATRNRECNELWASTKPRPWWRSDLDSTITGRARRRSYAGEILERNICFVDPASSRLSTTKRCTESDYINTQLSPLFSKPMDDSDLRTILSEGGIPIVDVVLYLIPHTGLKDEDIQCIKSLEDKTNVVALLARSDELDSSTISASKQRIRQQISQHGLDCFSFATPDLASDITDIFSVSSATATDYSIMDASTLMNSCYMQPLILTDLSRLVEHLFSSDGCAWLRHSAAAKCIEWRRSQDRGFHLDMALTRRDPTDYALSSILTTNPFVPRQLWGRVELSNWAQCLRDSLHSEQTQHQSEQRAIVEMYARQLSDQDLLRLRGGGVACVNSRMGVKRGSTRPFTHQDPLGILEVGSHLKRNGQWTFELMGSMGVLGCMAAFLAGPDSWMCPRVLRELTRDVFNWSLV